MDRFRSVVQSLLPSQWARAATTRNDPVAVQREQLRRLLRRAQDTTWGQAHGYAELCRSPDCVRAFQDRVPLRDFATLQPYVERILAGEPDILWPGRIRNFAVSSGTASKGKLIPLSAAMLRHIRWASVRVALNYMRTTRNFDIALGSLLSLPGHVDLHPQYPSIRVGEMSGFIAESAPKLLARYWQAAPVHTFDPTNWNRKLDRVVACTLDTDVRAISMVPTWGPVLFNKLLTASKKRHQRTVESVHDVWPHLRVIFSGGVALSSYRDLLEDMLGGSGSVDFIELYGASEGFFAMQMHPADEDMQLQLDTGVFYEFVPVDELGAATPQRYTVADVSPGVRYALYVSTCSGLWACGVRDVVRFTSTFPHRLVVAGRTGEMIDGHGERVFVEEAREALDEACAETDAHIADFHIAPYPVQREEVPTHQWLIEFYRVPTDIHAFSRTLDHALRRMNRHYRIRRVGGAFGAPHVQTVPRGTFYAWLTNTRDRVGAQSKVPRMRADRQVAEPIMTYLKEHTPL